MLETVASGPARRQLDDGGCGKDRVDGLTPLRGREAGRTDRRPADSRSRLGQRGTVGRLKLEAQLQRREQQAEAQSQEGFAKVRHCLQASRTEEARVLQT